jgi:hypothetical protein
MQSQRPKKIIFRNFNPTNEWWNTVMLRDYERKIRIDNRDVIYGPFIKNILIQKTKQGKVKAQPF